MVDVNAASTCVPAPEGRPLLRRSNQRPAVGYAQQCLHNWIEARRSGRAPCSASDRASERFVDNAFDKLERNGERPLVVDCIFGAMTKLAVQAFQRCNGISVDGIIGPISWPLLEQHLLPATPPTPQTTLFVREDAWTLSNQATWHPTLLWYARGVAALQLRDVSDPMSWLHIANAHGVPEDDPPVRGSRWDECQHGSWFFLPWHRIYLHHLERILRDTIGGLGGPADWALPYWDYSDAGRADVRRLPPAFREAQTPDGVPNPLRVGQRSTNLNTGGELLPQVVDTANAMGQTAFIGPSDRAFGGGQTGPAHFANEHGAVEMVPHNVVHSNIGGLMGDPNLAARDPIFWLHHANIDRLWEAWLRQPGRSNATSSAWIGQGFELGGGSVLTRMTVGQSLVIATAPLSYRYSDMLTAPTLSAGRPTGAGAQATPGDGPDEVIGATSEPVRLRWAATTAEIGLTPPAGPVATRMTAAADVAAEAQVTLTLSNITGTQEGPRLFGVFVNIPAGGDPEDFPAMRAGTLPMFGVVKASAATRGQGGAGIDVSYDITAIARTLAASGDWDPGQVRVTVSPMDSGEEDLPDGDVAIGQISVKVR